MSAAIIVHNVLRIATVSAGIIVNIIARNNLNVKKRQQEHNSCPGCTTLANVFLIGGFISLLDLSSYIEYYDFRINSVCAIQLFSSEIFSYFLLVILALICLSDVSRARMSSLWISSMPWLVTIVIYCLPCIVLTGGRIGTYDYFLVSSVSYSDDDQYDLWMCGRDIQADRLLLGVQYLVSVVPVCLVILVSGLVLVVRKWRTERRKCCLDVDDSLVEDTSASFSIKVGYQGGELVPTEKENEESALEADDNKCAYETIKLDLFIFLITNMIWMCVVRPILIVTSPVLNPSDIGTFIILDCFTLYLPITFLRRTWKKGSIWQS